MRELRSASGRRLRPPRSSRSLGTSPQPPRSWRGVWILHDVQDGAFDEMPVSLSFLQDKYGSKKGVAA